MEVALAVYVEGAIAIDFGSLSGGCRISLNFGFGGCLLMVFLDDVLLRLGWGELAVYTVQSCKLL